MISYLNFRAKNQPLLWKWKWVLKLHALLDTQVFPMKTDRIYRTLCKMSLNFSTKSIRQNPQGVILRQFLAWKFKWNILKGYFCVKFYPLLLWPRIICGHKIKSGKSRRRSWSLMMPPKIRPWIIVWRTFQTCNYDIKYS